MTLAVEANVNGVVITLLPLPTPSAVKERCIAAVQDVTPIEQEAPVKRENSFSNKAVSPPVVSHPLLITRIHAFISSLEKYGLKNGINFFILLTCAPAQYYKRGDTDSHRYTRIICHEKFHGKKNSFSVKIREDPWLKNPRFTGSGTVAFGVSQTC